MKIRFWHYGLLFGVLISALAGVFLHYSSYRVLTVENAQLDLSGMTPREIAEPHALQGEWEFYPDLFLLPGESVSQETEKYLLQVPGVWNSQLPHLSGFSRGRGFGTYRLTVKLPPGKHRLGFIVHDPATACRLFVNERELVSIGVPGKTSSESIPRYEYRTVYFEGEGTIRILFHFSNYHHRRGGFWDAPLLGGEQDIVRISLMDYGISYLFMGSLLIVGFYHLIIYILGCRYKSYLYFFWLCLSMTARVLSTNTFLFSFFIPSIPWWLQTKLEYLSFVGIFVSAIFLYNALFQKTILNRRVLKVCILVFILYGLMILLFPLRVYNILLSPIQLFGGLTCIWIVIALFRSVIFKIPDSFILLCASAFFFLTYINDTLYIYFVQKNSRMGNLVPFGLLFLVAATAFVLARQYRDAIQTSERLTDILDDTERINQQLRKDAYHDKLTSLLNRFELDRQSAELNREPLRDLPLSLVYVDLDNFKAINDQAGHPAGDFVLKEVAGIIQCEFRHSDRAFRIGGDEFVIIMPDASSRGAAGSVERLLNSIEKRDSFSNEIRRQFNKTLNLHSPLSCSAGIAERRKGELIEDLIRRADQALLESKARGKNCYSISTL